MQVWEGSRSIVVFNCFVSLRNGITQLISKYFTGVLLDNTVGIPIALRINLHLPLLHSGKGNFANLPSAKVSIKL